MDSSDSWHSALDAIDTVAFKVGLKGYNVDEVDEFLERVSSEARQLKDQLQQMRLQLRQASERISQLSASGAAPATGPTPITNAAPPVAPPPVAPARAGTGAEQVTSMIAMAQRFIEQAQQEAELKAREMTGAAQERAREIVAEARSRAEDEVNRLNGLKQRLSEDVETLTRQLESERTRLASVLAEFSRWLESSLHVGGTRLPNGAASPTPTTPPAPTNQAPERAVPSMLPARPVGDTRPTTPPPAPPAAAPTIGQVLNFEQPSREERS
jgi:cell division initiation protein